MQRHSNYLDLIAAQGATNFPGLNQGSRPDPRNPVTGIYGSGRVQIMTVDGNFTVPAGCTKIRPRGFGAPGTDAAAGGVTSFGAYFSITGGQSGASAQGLGGVATGGDVNYNGGKRNGKAGGPAANVFGPGDRVGGAGGNGSQPGRSGISGRGGQLSAGQDSGMGGGNGEVGRTDGLDWLGTGGGGSGGGGNIAIGAGNGSNGGGGGGGDAYRSPGKGGFPGGADGAPDGPNGGPGGGGFSIKEITGLVPGAVIAVTVPEGALIAVEW